MSKDTGGLPWSVRILTPFWRTRDPLDGPAWRLAMAWIVGAIVLGVFTWFVASQGISALAGVGRLAPTIGVVAGWTLIFLTVVAARQGVTMPDLVR